MATTKVAVVTGSNKGIGFAIIKGLFGKFDGDIILTARSEERGLAALEELTKVGVKVKFHQLDIDNKKSIEALAKFLKETYGGLDLLVNNAATAFKNDSTVPFSEQARVTIGTNYFSVKQTCDILFPLLRDSARVVNVSSAAGLLGFIKGNGPAALGLRARFALSGWAMTVDELSALMKEFVTATEAGNWVELGWPSSTYVVSKIGLCALSRIQQRAFDQDKRKDLVINYVHPGYVDTDMSSHKGPKTTEEGAKSALYAALLPPGTDIKGQFIWDDCGVVDWVNEPIRNFF